MTTFSRSRSRRNCVGRKINEKPDGPCNGFDVGEMPKHSLYFGNPWFLFAIESWYQFQDAFDQWRVRWRGRQA